MIVYHIRNWAKSFENNKSRVIGACRYVCMPNKQDGLGLLRILAQEDGAAIFGVWCLILQACSRQVKRDGWLTDDGTENGRPWDLEDLAFRWRRPIREIERALSIFCDHKIAWMERLQSKCPSGGTECPSGALNEGRKEQREGTPGGAAVPDIDLDGIADPRPVKKTTEPEVDRMSDDEVFRLGSRWVACHSKDPDRKAELRQTVIDLTRHHGKRWLEVSERLRWQLNEKPWPEQVEAELAEVLAREVHPQVNPDDQVIAQARALVRQHGVLPWLLALGVSRKPPFSIDEFLDLLPENLPMCDRIIAMGKPGAA